MVPDEHPVFREYGFPPYPGVTFLCQQRVYSASGPHITWQAVTTPAPPEVVIAHYRAALGAPSQETDDPTAFWRDSEPAPQRVLDVRPAAGPGPHRSCGAPPPDTGTVLILSRR